MSLGCKGGVTPMTLFAMSRSLPSRSSPCGNSAKPENIRFDLRPYCSMPSSLHSSPLTFVSSMTMCWDFSSSFFLKTHNCFSQVTYFVRQFLWKEHRFHFVEYCAIVENGNHFHDELVVVASLLRGALPGTFRHDWCDRCSAAR